MNSSGIIRREKQRLQDGHISAWRKSGLSPRDYCRQHRLRPSTFASWLAQQEESENRAVTLVPVPEKICRLPSIVPMELETSGLCLVIGRRCRVEIGKHFDSATFAQVVAVLEGR